MLMGNHDDNSYAGSSDSYDTYCITDAEWNQWILDEFVNVTVVHDSTYADSKYFYYDITKNGQKYRLVGLDSVNGQQASDTGESFTGSPFGESYWGYSKKQLDWLANQAMTDPNAEYIFLSHMSADGEVDDATRQNGALLNNILVALQNHTTVDVNGTIKDFSAFRGDVLVYSFGHVHIGLMVGDNKVRTDNGLAHGYITTCTPSLKYFNQATSRGLEYGWENLTTARDVRPHHSFDAFSVNADRVARARFGQGEFIGEKTVNRTNR